MVTIGFRCPATINCKGDTLVKNGFNSAATALAVVLCGWLQSSAVFGACEPLLPNLRALPASDIRLVLDARGDPVELRFAATTWNSGSGQLRLVAKSIDTTAQKQRVDQRIFDNCGAFQDRTAGSFTWHQDHNHFHFDGYANYFLTPLGTQGQGRNGSKTTFCIMDTTSVNMQLVGASSQIYGTCGNTVQGLSVGWGDTYGSQLAGQSINAVALLPGDYALEINVDPFGRILETNEDDNWSCVHLRFSGSPYASSFNILDRRIGRCGEPEDQVALASITPNQVPLGWTGTVTIVGTGLDPIMPVNISSGSDEADVSNVAFLDSTTIQATVKVRKKKRVRDPLMDVQVGPASSYAGSASLPDGFRVAP
jgi:hypothetical protein